MPLAERTSQSIQDDYRQQNGQWLPRNVSDDLRGSNGMAIYGDLMSNYADGVIEDLTIWANLPSTTEKEIDEVRGDIDGSQAARMTDKVAKVIDKSAGVVGNAVGIVNKLGSKIVEGERTSRVPCSMRTIRSMLLIKLIRSFKT